MGNTKPTTETWFYRVDIPSDRKHFSKTKPMELKHFDDCIAWWNNREVIPDGEYFKAQKYTADYLLNEQGCNIDLCGYPHEEEEVLAPADLIQKYEEKRASLNAEIDRTILALSASLNGEPVNFDTQGTISSCGKMDDLHKRFPEDMKKSILQYAIQGKLVEQRLEEGTGAELYKQMQWQKVIDAAIKKVVSRFMRKFDSGIWQKSITGGVLRRPLGYFRAVGAQRVKGGGSRLSCP